MSASESLLSNLSNEDGSVTFSAGLECRPSSRLASSKSLAGPDSNDQKSNEKLEKEPKPSIVRTEYNRQTLNSNFPFFYEVEGPHREGGILLSSLEDRDISRGGGYGLKPPTDMERCLAVVHTQRGIKSAGAVRRYVQVYTPDV
ncbi:hypothetical protein TESG_04773 [Trichophyton tonsurans CBS 112818]|uniref:Uncharacterized protein n=1 Tax=Trichophyton tonsurans (strain CBS 112818) TaxID=647933 RepID=F2S1B3_TRIT1|nr:hypothetical protein TESG_04773 [Trichophyton tonsurans CBS 112818]